MEDLTLSPSKGGVVAWTNVSDRSFRGGRRGANFVRVTNKRTLLILCARIGFNP